jgi:hypothetical protein
LEAGKAMNTNSDGIPVGSTIVGEKTSDGGVRWTLGVKDPAGRVTEVTGRVGHSLAEVAVALERAHRANITMPSMTGAQVSGRVSA